MSTGAVNNSDKSAMNDGAFDGFLKQVESMHTQGKSSFEDEFNVSKMFFFVFLTTTLPTF